MYEQACERVVMAAFAVIFVGVLIPVGQLFIMKAGAAIFVAAMFAAAAPRA